MAKFPLSQLPMLCTAFVRNEINVVKLATMPPIIIPNSGTKMTSFTLIKSIILTNKMYPDAANNSKY